MSNAVEGAGSFPSTSQRKEGNLVLTDFKSKHLMKMVDQMDVNNGMYSTFIEQNAISMEKFFFHIHGTQKSFLHMFFFVWITDGYDLSG